MAEPDLNDTPAGFEWVLLKEFIERKRVEVLSRELAERLARRELNERKWHYRYLDRDGQLHQDDAPDGLWLARKFNLETSSAFQEPNWSLGISREEIYRIEVLVPVQPVPDQRHAGVDPFRTGSAGRPSASHHVLDEAKRRISKGEVKVRRGGLASFARDLVNWWETERQKYNPPGPPLVSKTVQQTVRPVWHKALSKKPKT
jgi:hypothetical protein